MFAPAAQPEVGEFLCASSDFECFSRYLQDCAQVKMRVHLPLSGGFHVYTIVREDFPGYCTLRHQLFNESDLKVQDELCFMRKKARCQSFIDLAQGCYSYGELLAVLSEEELERGLLRPKCDETECNAQDKSYCVGSNLIVEDYYCQENRCLLEKQVIPQSRECGYPE